MSTDEFNVDYSNLFEDNSEKNKKKSWLKRLRIPFIVLAVIVSLLYFILFTENVPSVNLRTAEAVELLPSEIKKDDTTTENAKIALATLNNNAHKNIVDNSISIATTPDTKQVTKTVSAEATEETLLIKEEELDATIIEEIQATMTESTNTILAEDLKTDPFKETVNALASKADKVAQNNQTEILNKEQPTLISTNLAVAAIENTDKISTNQPKIIKAVNTIAKADVIKTLAVKKATVYAAVNKSQSAEIDDIIKQIANVRTVTEYSSKKTTVAPKDIIASVSSTISSADINKAPKKKASSIKKNTLGVISAPKETNSIQKSFHQGFDSTVKESDLESIYNITF